MAKTRSLIIGLGLVFVLLALVAILLTVTREQFLGARVFQPEKPRAAVEHGERVTLRIASAPFVRKLELCAEQPGDSSRVDISRCVTLAHGVATGMRSVTVVIPRETPLGRARVVSRRRDAQGRLSREQKNERISLLIRAAKTIVLTPEPVSFEDLKRRFPGSEDLYGALHINIAYRNPRRTSNYSTHISLSLLSGELRLYPFRDNEQQYPRTCVYLSDEQVRGDFGGPIAALQYLPLVESWETNVGRRESGEEATTVQYGGQRDLKNHIAYADTTRELPSPFWEINGHLKELANRYCGGHILGG